MNKPIFLSLILGICLNTATAQIVHWQIDSPFSSRVAWDNYSTSYIGKGFDNSPTLVVAIPYNGIYEMNDSDAARSKIDLSSASSRFRIRGNELDKTLMMDTYDSSDVYLLAPGIFRSKGADYEYRVLLNDSLVIVPWRPVTEFTDSTFQLGIWRRNFGFLGGYHTTWDNWVTAELREIKTGRLLSIAKVYWKQVRPRIRAIFTPAELTDYLLRTKQPFDLSVNTGGAPVRTNILKPDEKELLFFLNAGIYKRNALEYRVTRDAKCIVDWKANDFDNNFLRLSNLLPGDYVLQLRYRAQRQNVSTYAFRKEPYWYQRREVKLAVLLLIIAIGGLLIRLLALNRQKKALAATNQKMSAMANELRYIQAQLNPHFTFNALSSIQGLINKNEITQANSYLTEFSNLLRETLANNEKGMVPLHAELKILKRYLRLEQLRFNFRSEIVVDENIKDNEVMFPSLLLQPLVENAVKHGAGGMQEAGMVRIRISGRNGNLEATITDNGKGFDPGPVSEGLGLKLTRDRIELINRSVTGRSVTMQIQSSSSAGTVVPQIQSSSSAGTCIRLTFNNWLQ